MLEFLKIVDIPGWMGDAELEYLHKMVAEAPPSALIVEGGAWYGRSTAAQYTAIHDQQTVVTIDTWLGQADMRFGVHQDVLYDDIFLKFLEYMEKLDIYPRWYRPGKFGPCYLRMNFADATLLFADKSVDRAFLDGDHNDVGKDIDSIRPKLAPGAILCGHDWNWTGVKQQLESRLSIADVVGDLWIASPMAT